jgi:hypothetical protein
MDVLHAIERVGRLYLSMVEYSRGEDVVCP